MARRYPSSGNYDTGRYSRGYVPVNSSSYIGGPGPGDRQRQEPVSYRDRWLGSRTQTETDSYRHRSSSPDRQFRHSQTVSSAGPAAYRSRSFQIFANLIFSCGSDSTITKVHLFVRLYISKTPLYPSPFILCPSSFIIQVFILF